MHSTHRNRLAEETSPYLQQHAGNPVDWYPWCEAALEKARAEDKPILLSIGYSACHWCHVMAHESFEDEETAALMNRLYVNIKVDREERPDLDKIYQLAQQVLTQRTGGWPLTMFLTPTDHLPFFGGTYFPPAPRHGLPAFRDLLERIAEVYRSRRAEIEDQNRSMSGMLAQVYRPAPAGEPSPAWLAAAVDQARQNFDAEHGGFGRAPKFPHTPQLERLLQHWARAAAAGDEDGSALQMAVHTLTKMAAGGMFDHLGGGFCRYSVDDQWMIPHFEKMLYDNGPLLAVYAQAATALQREDFRATAQGVADWVMREMQSPEGGYYSSLDADSAGEEGRFYVWDAVEVRGLLSDEEYALFAPRFGLDRAPNFEGRWHLHAYVSLDALSLESGLSLEQVQAVLETARAKLFAQRAQRVHPGRDDKILTSWNALMIRGMAIAARHLALPACLESAEHALAFIRARLWKDGRLLATYKDGKAHLPAYLDDYAFLIDAILELLQTRWSSAALAFATELAEVLLRHFQEPQTGGFYFTADDHPALIERPRSFADESLPNGNAIAARALARLGWLLTEPRYLEAAERTLKAGAAAVAGSPLGHCALLNAYDEQRDPPRLVILRGEGEDFDTLQVRAGQTYASGRLCFAIPAAADRLPPALADKKLLGEVTAYVCTGTSCSAPLAEPAEIAAALAA